uniref:Uncharacterized protein n=1 Tax=Caenorhabditis tropicalis TaxID=1561998 RepID=A0A1I7T5W6_9PELO
MGTTVSRAASAPNRIHSSSVAPLPTSSNQNNMFMVRIQIRIQVQIHGKHRRDLQYLHPKSYQLLQQKRKEVNNNHIDKKGNLKKMRARSDTNLSEDHQKEEMENNPPKHFDDRPAKASGTYSFQVLIFHQYILKRRIHG